MIFFHYFILPNPRFATEGMDQAEQDRKIIDHNSVKAFYLYAGYTPEQWKHTKMVL